MERCEGKPLSQAAAAPSGGDYTLLTPPPPSRRILFDVRDACTNPTSAVTNLVAASVVSLPQSGGGTASLHPAMMTTFDNPLRFRSALLSIPNPVYQVSTQYHVMNADYQPPVPPRLRNIIAWKHITVPNQVGVFTLDGFQPENCI